MKFLIILNNLNFITRKDNNLDIQRYKLILQYLLDQNHFIYFTKFKKIK